MRKAERERIEKNDTINAIVLSLEKDILLAVVSQNTLIQKYIKKQKAVCIMTTDLNSK